MSLPAIAAYALALAIAAAIPGPGVAAVVGSAIARGPRDALATSVGIVLGDVLYLTAAIGGLAVIAESFGKAFIVIRWAGGAYLLWMAWRLWTAEIKPIDPNERRANSSGWRGLLSGFLLTLGNPKAMMFYLALVPIILDLRDFTLIDYAEAVLMTAMVLLAVLAPYVAIASHARRLFTSIAARRRMNRGASVCVAGAAIAVVSR